MGYRRWRHVRRSVAAGAPCAARVSHSVQLERRSRLRLGIVETVFRRLVGGIGWNSCPEWPGLSAGHALPDCGVLWLDWSTQPGTENARWRYCQEDGRTGKTDARSRPRLDSHSARTRRRLDF